MTEKHEKLLLDLEFRIHQLMYLCDSLKNDNLRLKEELEMKLREIEFANSSLEQLNLKYNNLESANALIGQDTESVEKTKNRLYNLVQEVEKCISLLRV